MAPKHVSTCRPGGEAVPALDGNRLRLRECAQWLALMASKLLSPRLEP